MNPANTVSAEARATPRKILRRPVRITVKGIPAVTGKTVDISATGICIIAPMAIAVGQMCMVVLEILVNGKIRKITAVGKAAYSVCSGTEGFRVGLQFLEIDPASSAAINDFMH